MRATIEGIEVEGTPEEIAALIRAHRTVATSSSDSKNDQKIEDVEEDHRFASEKVAFRALRRRPLSSAQRKLFQELLKAYPGWTSSTGLQKATGYNPNQLGGLLGAIGRRLSQTDGYVLGSGLIEWMWDADENEYAYRLPPSVFHAVQRIGP